MHYRVSYSSYECVSQRKTSTLMDNGQLLKINNDIDKKLS